MRLERQPVTFMVRELEPLLDAARVALADFVGAACDDLVLLGNATAGVNTVLRSLQFDSDDELLVSDHEYNACRNALDYVAQRSGARVVVAAIPFPLQSGKQVVAALLQAVTPRTRLLLIDHVSSQTAVVMPLADIVREFAVRGIDTLVDGAHAPGMLALDVDAIGAAYYTGNCHKWICAPKGAGFLHVRKDRQQHIRPLSISHGANSTRDDRSRFQIEFGWTGTGDPTALLCVPDALDYLGALLPGGWPELMQRNHQLAVAARDVLCEELDLDPPCPAAMIGSMAAVHMADSSDPAPPRSALYLDRWQDLLLQRWGDRGSDHSLAGTAKAVVTCFGTAIQ